MLARFFDKPKDQQEHIIDDDGKEYIVIVTTSFVNSTVISVYRIKSNDPDKVELWVRRQADKLENGFCHVKSSINPIEEIKRIEL